MATPAVTPDPNATPAPAPDLAGNVPGSALNSVPQQPPAPQQPTPAPPPAPQSQPQPQQPGSLWKQVLQGALEGLAGSKGATHFGGGAAGGAANYFEQRQQQFQNQQQAQQATSLNNFRDIQSASLAAQMTREDAMFKQQSAAAQSNLDNLLLERADKLQKLGFDVSILPNTAQAAQASLNSGPNGGVVNPGSTISPSYILRMNTDGSDQNGLSKQYGLYQSVAPAIGLMPMSRAQFNSLTPEQRNVAMGQLYHTLDAKKADGSPIPANEIEGQANAWQQTVANAKKQGAPQDVLDMLDLTSRKYATQVQAMKDNQQRQFDNQKEVAKIRAAEINSGRPVQVDNPDGTTGYDTAGHAIAANATHSGNALLMGTLPNGQQVAGSAQELKQAGAASVSKLSADEAAKIHVARQAIAPDGLFASVGADIKNLEASGDLGTVATRWNDFLAGKVGSQPQFAKLRTDMGLLGTALMQAHVGARGGENMLEHFKSLADYRISDAATLKAALSSEFKYVQEKAAFIPKTGGK